MTTENMVYDVDVMAGRPPTKEAPPFGKRLAAARKSKGWSQAELARRLHATRALIDYYERRAKNPTIEFVQRAAEALDVSVEELVNGEGKEIRRRPGPASKIEKQIEDIRRLPRTKQRFVSELLDTVLKTAD
jgi:transcriptional regulator with XRE-family HTH domain